eukprot:PhM_4_TR3059/c0_g1_i1/m.97750
MQHNTGVVIGRVVLDAVEQHPIKAVGSDVQTVVKGPTLRLARLELLHHRLNGATESAVDALGRRFEFDAFEAEGKGVLLVVIDMAADVSAHSVVGFYEDLVQDRATVCCKDVGEDVAAEAWDEFITFQTQAPRNVHCRRGLVVCREKHSPCVKAFLGFRQRELVVPRGLPLWIDHAEATLHCNINELKERRLILIVTRQHNAEVVDVVVLLVEVAHLSDVEAADLRRPTAAVVDVHAVGIDHAVERLHGHIHFAVLTALHLGVEHAGVAALGGDVVHLRHEGACGQCWLHDVVKEHREEPADAFFRWQRDVVARVVRRSEGVGPGAEAAHG